MIVRFVLLCVTLSVLLQCSAACLKIFPHFFAPRNSTSLPIVTWHGISNNAAGNQNVVDAILETIPDAHIVNVMVGEDNDIDEANSVLMRARDQVEYVCEVIKSDPLLADGYHGLGISQGGLMMRGLAEICPDPPMKNLITYGAPSNGIFGVPDCVGSTGSEDLCELVRQLLSAGAYEPWIQNLITPAQYWRDPFNHTMFVEGSIFLADINNFKEDKNEVYKEAITNLDNFVMIMWEDDTTIVPRISSHFGFYAMGQDNVTQPLQESDLYKEDWLGLRTLDEDGRLHFLSIPGDHMDIDWDWFRDEIVLPYLS